MMVDLHFEIDPLCAIKIDELGKVTPDLKLAHIDANQDERIWILHFDPAHTVKVFIEQKLLRFGYDAISLELDRKWCRKFAILIK